MIKRGYLSEYFSGVCAKRLSAVETDAESSNQHEFNGVEQLKAILGEPTEQKIYPTRFLYLDDDIEVPLACEGTLTWYDARRIARVERNVMRWEYRLYYKKNQILSMAVASDLLLIGKLRDESLLAIVAKNGSTAERQLLWLFDIDADLLNGFEVRPELDSSRDELGFAAKLILEQVGVSVTEDAPDFLEQMIQKFSGTFPGTRVFSAFARETLVVNALDAPDGALLAWMEREELLFRTLERHLLMQKLAQLQGESIDPDAFMSLAMSFQQRRKSRAGSALENHLEIIFTQNGIQYSRTPVTEKGLKPDFIFPGIVPYKNPDFPATRLTMVAAKTTCKDRWRQILNEASRIPAKHLLTLEPSISRNQTEEMKGEQVQLVVPLGLQPTYLADQQEWLMSIADLLAMAKERQN